MIEDALRRRRSVRRFKADPVPEELVVRLLEGAITAPSASNKQPWKFLVVENRSLITRMADAVRTATALIAEHIPEESRAAFVAYGDYFTRFEAAPLVIVPICRPLTLLSNLTGESLPDARRACVQQLEATSGLVSTSLALGNILLLAEELGLGASGMTGPLVARAELKQLLDVPNTWDIVALVPIGFPAEFPEPTERKSMKFVSRWYR
ncbi:MAG TPA: nitroreductase family protein [Polyangiaceae bacterium]|nr:nitroreductase family protein [Polyangiaceae bacterium]